MSSKTFYVFGFAALIVFDTFSQICFIGEFVAWLAFLSLVPLAQGVLLGTTSIVVVMLGGRIMFHERFSRLRIAGILLIVAGVAIVGVG